MESKQMEEQSNFFNDLNDPYVLYLVAFAFQRNNHGADRDMSKAIDLLKRAVDLNGSRAMVELSLCYKKGDGVEQDIPEAIALFQRAIDLNDSYAMKYLDDSVLIDEEIILKEIDKAISWKELSNRDRCESATPMYYYQKYKSNELVNEYNLLATELYNENKYENDSFGLLEYFLNDHNNNLIEQKDELEKQEETKKNDMVIAVLNCLINDADLKLLYKPANGKEYAQECEK